MDVLEPRNSMASESTNSQRLGFFDLPAEIRLRIYDFVLVRPQSTVDLHPENYRSIAPRLSCFRVSRRMHDEAYHVFYGSPAQPLRLYPIHGRFFHTKKPLLTRLTPQYRRAINTVELTLGRGWSKPPKCWHTGPSLGLVDCKSLRTLKLFIETDPSDDTFNGFRGEGNTKDTYKNFCLDILQGIFEQTPSLETIEIDANPAVSKETPLVQSIVREIETRGKRLVWGPRRWGEMSETSLLGLEKALAAFGI